jgi:hypothetical protein
LLALLGTSLACPTSASAEFGYLGGFPAIGGEIAVDDQGYVYAFDFNEGRVRKYSPQGELVLAWGNDELGLGEPIPHNSEPGKFDQPSDITTDPAGNVYVADPVNRRVQKFSSQGELIDANFGGVVMAQLASDIAGNIYGADGYLTKVSPSGQVIYRHWAGAGSGVHSIVVDGTGRPYVSSFSANQIIQYDADGMVLRRFPPLAAKGDGLGEFSEVAPGALAFDGEGYLWVGDTGNYRMTKWDVTTGKLVMTCATEGGDDSFEVFPADLATAPNGDILSAGLSRFGATAPAVQSCEVVPPRVTDLEARLGRSGRRIVGARLELSKTSWVGLWVRGRTRGIVRRGRCRFTSERVRDPARRCTKRFFVGSAAKPGQPGRNKFSFEEDAFQQRLRPGRYVLLARAHDSVGYSSPSVKDRFVVKRR